jgi:hypothetical protein
MDDTDQVGEVLKTALGFRVYCLLQFDELLTDWCVAAIFKESESSAQGSSPISPTGKWVGENQQYQLFVQNGNFCDMQVRGSLWMLIQDVQVMLWHFLSHTRKVMSALFPVMLPSKSCCWVFAAISSIWVLVI